MNRVGRLPTPVPRGNIVEAIGRLLPQKTAPTIGIATIIAVTVVGLIFVNLGDFQPGGDGSQRENPTFAAGVWRKQAAMPTPRVGLSTVVVNGKIYAIGGLVGWPAVALPAVETYDSVTDTWTKKADMSTPRAFPAAGVVDGKIYVIGGAWKWPPVAQSAAEVYGPETDTWVQKADMPTPRWGYSASVVDGKIYVISGGAGDGVALPTVEMYNPATDTWVQKADMPTPRWHPASSVVNGKIYVIGGCAPCKR